MLFPQKINVVASARHANPHNETVVVQNDTAVEFYVAVVGDNGQTELPEGATYTLVCLHLRKQPTEKLGTLQADGNVMFKLTHMELSETGPVQGQVRVYHPVGGRLTSNPFIFHVAPDPTYGAEIKPEDQSIIEQVIGEGPAIIAEAKEETTKNITERARLTGAVDGALSSLADDKAQALLEMSQSKGAADQSAQVAQQAADNADDERERLTLEVSDKLNEVETARSATVEATGEATEAAGLARDEADAARLQKEEVQDILGAGPVASVNGETGVVTGLATQESMNQVTAQLAEKVSKEELQQVSLSFKESYDTLALLQAAYPTGDQYNHTVKTDGMIYTYKNEWVSTGIQANGTGIAKDSITLDKINENSVNFDSLAQRDLVGINKFDESKQTLQTITDNHVLNNMGQIVPLTENYYVTAPIYLKPNKIYSLPFPTWGSAANKGAIYNDKDEVLTKIESTTFTTPSDTAYVLFTCYKLNWNGISCTLDYLKNNFMIVEGTVPPSNYVKYGLFFPENITLNGYAKIEEVGTLPIFIHKESDIINVISKYNATEDLRIGFRKRGGNNLLDFHERAKIYNPTEKVSNLANSGSVVFSNVTDFFAPFVVKAVGNIDGDRPESTYFTGGNHNYNNSGSTDHSPTARTVEIVVYVDGREVGEFYEGYANFIDIHWKNRIQANNTTKIDGTGREVLEEHYHLHFDGFKWEVENEIKALEEVAFSTYYGIQASLAGFPSGKYFFKGSDVNKGANNIGTSSNSGDKKTSAILIKGVEDSMELGIIKNIGLGDFSKSTNANSAFASGTKVYFNIIRAASNLPTLSAGEMFYFQGWYRFMPTK